MLSVVMLSVIMGNVTYKPFMLSVVMLNVMAPIWQHGIVAGTTFSYDPIKSILFYFLALLPPCFQTNVTYLA